MSVQRTVSGDRRRSRIAVAAALQYGALDIPDLLRWNDYGNGLLAKPHCGILRQAEAAFQHVADLVRAEGDLNLYPRADPRG